MAKNPGRIVRFIKKDGSAQMAMQYNKDQKPEHAKLARVFLILVDDGYRVMRDDAGRILTSTKNIRDIKYIGNVD